MRLKPIKFTLDTQDLCINAINCSCAFTAKTNLWEKKGSFPEEYSCISGITACCMWQCHRLDVDEWWLGVTVCASSGCGEPGSPLLLVLCLSRVTFSCLCSHFASLLYVVNRKLQTAAPAQRPRLIWLQASCVAGKVTNTCGFRLCCRYTKTERHMQRCRLTGSCTAISFCTFSMWSTRCRSLVVRECSLSRSMP